MQFNTNQQTEEQHEVKTPSPNVLQIPQGVTVLQEHMLGGGNSKERIRSIILPESLKRIEDHALY